MSAAELDSDSGPLRELLKACKTKVNFDVQWSRVLRTGDLSDVTLSASILTAAGAKFDMDLEVKKQGQRCDSPESVGILPAELGLTDYDADADHDSVDRVAQSHSPLAPKAGSERWLASVLKIQGEHDLCERFAQIRDAAGGHLHYGSDCSGVDSPAIALKILIKRLQSTMQDRTCDLELARI